MAPCVASSSTGTTRGAVVARLVADGYEARVERAPGRRDDDGDHPWAVVTDAPQIVLELLVDERDGWLDAGRPRAGGPPLELPTAPKRIKRPS